MHMCVRTRMHGSCYVVIKLQMCVYWLQVIAYHKAVASAQQNAAESQNTGLYASPKKKVDKNKVLHTYVYVTLFWKTDHVVTFSISRNTDFKYSMGCSSPMVQYSHARPTTLRSLVI